MKYLDIDVLRNLKREDFLKIKPYPYYNREGVLTESGFQDLLANMPPLDMFEQKFGYERRAGQAPHDRYSLEYEPGMPVPQPWQEFIAELRSDAYRDEVARLLGRKIEFRMHWHYTPAGADVSPHCDARREHGSHLFYFNSEQDWDPAWGGSTLVLDDGGRLDYNSAPDYDEFDAIHECQSIGNYSSLMLRTDHAWHAVRAIDCPEGRLRRVFIVVVNPVSLFWKLRDRAIGKKSSDSEGLPPPAADQVHLWLATRDAVTDSDGLTRAVLSRYTGCPPASLAFARGPHGKPQLLGGARALSFNLSDSGPWLALAVDGAAAVGVDLEFCDPARDVLKLARRCFRAAEIADMEAREGARLLDRFYDYWTLKEAGVKAVGGSLGRELQTTGFALTGGKPGAPESIEALEPATENCWYGLLEPLPQYRLALCCLGGADFSRGLRLLQWPPGNPRQDGPPPLRAVSGPLREGRDG